MDPLIYGCMPLHGSAAGAAARAAAGAAAAVLLLPFVFYHVSQTLANMPANIG